MSDVYQSLASPLQVGLQVPCCVRSQTATESDLREYPPSTGTDFPCAGETEGMPDRGGALDAGSCAHVHRDPAQAPGCFRDWIPEGKERDCHRTTFRKGEEFLRRTLLGPRLRGVHGRVRTRAGS